MKAIAFLLVFGLIVAAVFWKMRKAEAEAARARREALHKRKKKHSEALAQDTEMIWPVIVKTVSGKSPPGQESQEHEPSMTAIDFESAGPKTAQQGGSK
ncbi:MAG: hypothetical protein PVG42_02420 [Lysobacterales bacterium]|jgi:hypothetical protein